MLILLRVRIAESQEKSKTAMDGNRNFLVTREELFQSVSVRANEHGLIAFSTEKPLEEFTAEVLSLVDSGHLNLIKGNVRIGDADLFNAELKSHPFVKYLVHHVGDLFLSELTAKS